MKNMAERILMLCISLTFVFMSVLSFSCGIHVTPASCVEVQNNSDRTVVIFSRAFIDGEWGETRNWGQIDPGERRAVFALVAPGPNADDEKTRVEAKDLDGKLIKSWEFPFQERILLVIEKTVIPPENGMESSDNVTRK